MLQKWGLLKVMNKVCFSGLKICKKANFYTKMPLSTFPPSAQLTKWTNFAFSRFSLTNVVKNVVEWVIPFYKSRLLLKEAILFGGWDELFWQNRLGASIIVVWPRELVRLIGSSLENIFIIYNMVIRRLEKYLRACEVQIQIFWHLKKQ